MGRGQVRNSTDPAPPSGPAWQAFLARLWAGPWAGRGCFACGCPIAPGCGEAEHRISWRARPDLAWERFWKGEDFLVPVHGSDYTARGGLNKRCPTCDLACNMVIGSNAARRDELGRSVPLTPEEIAAAQARTRTRPRSGTGRDRRKSPGKPRTPRETAGAARVFPSAGRAW